MSEAESGKMKSVPSNSVMQIFSTILDRAKLAARAGFQFGDKRDMYAVFGYNRTLTPELLLGRYRRQDIARRIVDAPSKATWSDAPTITGSETFTKAWNDLAVKHNIFTILQRLDRLLGFGEYATLLIGLNDGPDLSRPAKMGVKPSGNSLTEVLYLQPYGQDSMEIKSWNEEPSSPRFGLPETYQLKAASSTSSTRTGAAKTRFHRPSTTVHWSRVVHIVEDPLEDVVFGIPRLEGVYNLLDDIMKIAGGTAESFWLTGNRGLHADVNPEMSFTTEEADALSDEFEEYMHQLRRVIRTRGVTLTPLGSDTPDPRGIFDVLIKLISGATGIPARILLGSEAGQLASQQDRANWANRIEERRNTFAEPYVLYPTFNRFVDLGILHEGPTRIEWPDAFKMNPLERGQTSAQVARSAANLTKAMETNKEIMSIEEARKIISFGDIEPILLDEPEDISRTET